MQMQQNFPYVVVQDTVYLLDRIKANGWGIRVSMLLLMEHVRESGGIMVSGIESSFPSPQEIFGGTNL